LEAPRALAKLVAIRHYSRPKKNLTIQGDDMAGKFEVYKDKSGEHRFRLKAGNGEIIL
jgi:hypothetical protein